MAKIDLFTWLDALWNKKRPEGTPPIYIMHRFLASEQIFAGMARHLQSDLRREPTLVFGTWQALLPTQKRAPRLQYVAAKKPKAAEELTERMMDVLGERREVVENMQEVAATAMAAQGRALADLYFYYGVEPPEDVPEEALEAQHQGGGGLLDL